MPGNDFSHIIERLPYARPFLFVDGLSSLDPDHVEGFYRFRSDSDFYRGHFKEVPVTPGVLLALLDMTEDQGRIAGLALTEAQMEFLEPVNPGELVRVTGQRVYFRFGKLKCNVCLYRENGLLACRGTISGMLNKEQV